MVSKTSICNKALRKLGVGSIINVDNDDSKQAKTCKAVYDDILLETLRAHNWNFAIFRQTLNKDINNPPAYGFSNKFVLPTIPQFVKLISVENNPEYKLENNFLLANEDEIKIRFVGKETDPNKYDSMFVELLALRIAWEVAYILTSDGGLVTRMQNDYFNALSLAGDKDFQEDNQVPIVISSYNMSRRSSLYSDLPREIRNLT